MFQSSLLDLTKIFSVYMHSLLISCSPGLRCHLMCWLPQSFLSFKPFCSYDSTQQVNVYVLYLGHIGSGKLWPKLSGSKITGENRE